MSTSTEYETFPIPAFAPVVDEPQQGIEDHHLLSSPQEEDTAGCCLHTSTSDEEKAEFSQALARLGIPIGVMHDSCSGLMNHLDSGEEYRWHEGEVQQFDREAYIWR